MGRRRSSDNHLPPKVYLRSGTYYFVDADAKWINLGRVYTQAMVKYAQLVECDYDVTTISDLIDRYLVEVAPQKAEATYKGNLAQAKFLRAGLGEIGVADLKSKHVYQYMDIRGRKCKTQTN